MTVILQKSNAPFIITRGVNDRVELANGEVELTPGIRTAQEIQADIQRQRESRQ